ncbi:alpha-L-rhamnosidase [Echinicola pacifica]|uniref:alpha-L-rhamnosidase n=1 Tax=Echinicola pacifica TaxID=346377 RepID=UPI0005C662CB|nr:alpha-L-rhamnosidase [Echinicola pacifica]
MNKHYLIIVLMGFLSFLILLSCGDRLERAPESLVLSEGFKNPLGFYDAAPTFSWKLPQTNTLKSQSAYQIVMASSPELLPEEADIWDSEKQATDQSTWVNYGGGKLSSRQKVYWQVRYWSQEGKESQWSEINNFELGLLSNKDWQARWVGLPTAKDSIKGVGNFLMHRPQYLRNQFDLPSNVRSARLYITAKGIFDVHLNGEDVSDDVMPPGWTPYNKRIETLTYDVTDQLSSGKNTLAVELASGWHSGRISRGTAIYDNFASPKLLCQLEITLEDGSQKVILSDQNWKGSTAGPIRLAGIYDGEVYDANYEIPNWMANDFDDASWARVEVEELDDEVLLEPKRHTAVKQKLEVPVAEIVAENDTAAIFDFGQNMVGVPLIDVPMRKGDTLRIRFSEMLAPDGSFYTDNYRSALSTDLYIAAEDKNVQWSPKFTFHGYRYIELTGFDPSRKPRKNWLTGLVQYSDIEQQGTFTSSNEKLNQLQSNIIWGLRSNFFDIPTDCPQRDERLGWTGDAQVIAPTSIFNFDMHAFWAAWLQSLRETQSEHENGLIPFIIPDVLQNNNASSGWGDAGVIIPWDIYMRTGDKAILAENYDMMKKWIAYHESVSENYISTMFSFADWLQPFPANENKKGDTPARLINTAYFAHAAHLTSRIAGILEKTEDQQKYEDLYKTVSNAFEQEFFEEDGSIKEGQGTQTGYLLAIEFDLLSEEKKPKAITHLLAKIHEADDHLRTGFLGTPLLFKVLDELGEIDLMYRILFQESYPSWFYSINQGATTMWERWNSYSKTEGYNSESMNSLNHYAYGAIGEWMYERIAGIQLAAPGYKSIRIAPMPHEKLSAAAATLDTPYGKVASSWEHKGSAFHLEITVPPNTSAMVILPANTGKPLTVDGRALEENPEVKLVNTEKQAFTLRVPAGTYRFQSSLN